MSPVAPGETVGQVFARLAATAPRILAGEQVSRPLAFDEHVHGGIEPSEFRGGSTFIFDLDALRDVPNSVPDLDGRETRRSDMIWALLNHHVHGRAIVRAPLPVFHDRSCDPATSLDLERCADDLRGYALVRALGDLLRRRASAGADDLRFSDDEVAFTSRRCQKYLRERAGALRLALSRARGAAVSAARRLADPTIWWNQHAAPREAARGLRSFLDALAAALTTDAIESAIREIEAPAPRAVEVWLMDLRDRVQGAAAGFLGEEHLQNEREANARAHLNRLFGARGWRLLGIGAEGVSLTDGRSVLKCIDHWKVDDPGAHRAWLRTLVGRWSGAGGLPTLLDVHDDGPRAVLVRSFEESRAYTGGLAEGLLQLLRECRDHGIVCRNLHPSNLRVVGEAVRLIDYGSDLRPWTPEDWRHMLRRAWLCWRWAHIPDLKDRMRRALTEDIAELDGWERLRDAVEIPSKESLVDGPVVALVDRLARGVPRRILDFGAGKGRIAACLVDQGHEVVAYDPARPTLAARARLTITDERSHALRLAPFDLVVSSLVLCVLGDDEYARALADLRRALDPGGRAVLVVCNPFFTLGGSTPLQHREVPPGAAPGRTFAWTKVVSATGAARRDVHRPFERLRRDLLRAGLVLEEVHATPAIDTVRLEPASDFLILVARAVEPSPDVTLVIKACAQEWRTLASQVRHLVDQLEQPGSFRERLLVLDPREHDLTRAYDVSDLGALRREADALVRDGVVDRIVEAPGDGAAAAAMLARWFDASSSVAHTVDGAPLTVALAGFEAATSDYVLQVDSDLLIARLDRSHDPVRELVSVFEGDPTALTASLNICRAADRPWCATDPDGRPWRVEVRGALFHRGRLLAGRPWPNEAEGGRLSRSWHRAVDRGLAAKGLRSYRGGALTSFFIHPTNQQKRERDLWLAYLDRVEDGWIPEIQRDHVDLQADPAAWFGPRREEPLVIVACGRDVPPGRLLRWLASLEAQS
ncbi:MAG TPA: class I SAM-dependent methyltransferase, partial [Nannocystaceae bacterium]|nr:class I SAM-dependent methyltransferase [Nannocystaceae bacterium]